MKLALMLLTLIALARVSSSSFTCVRSGELIPASRVNDDYCDCEDGTDETQTSACSSTLIDPFVCAFENISIPMSFVDDGICDCCDGTDENIKKCPNTCTTRLQTRLQQLKIEVATQLTAEKTKKEITKQSMKRLKALTRELNEAQDDITARIQDISVRYQKNKNDPKIPGEYQALMTVKDKVTRFQDLAAHDEGFGKKREYVHLVAKCFKTILNEKRFKGGSAEPVAKDFEFEFCPFDSVRQTELDENLNKVPGGVPTVLGLWDSWLNPTEQVYANGDKCWNGPDRTVTVKLECSIEDKILKVIEDGKCTYLLHFGTPSACSKPYIESLQDEITTINRKLAPKDEL